MIDREERVEHAEMAMKRLNRRKFSGAAVAAVTVALAVMPMVAAGTTDGVATVDFSKDVGTIKRLNGVCGWTRIAGTKYHNFDHLLKELDIPKARFHDAVLDNPGIQLIDVSRVFPLFHLDPDDPRNYDFKATDDLLRKVHEAGVEIEYRLGESIEHQGGRRYNCLIPEDKAKWAEICAHIVRHYNCGWANGYHWNIRDWAIWEEPNTVPELFDPGDMPYDGVVSKHYFPLYEATVKRLKSEFPEIRVCGPQAGISIPKDLTDFVDYCQTHALPIDVFTFGNYERDPDVLFGNVAFCRKYLDAHGFAQTKIQIGEWHWAPMSWKNHGSWPSQAEVDAWQAEVTGPQSGAYAAAVLARGQDYPVDEMAYYAVGTSTMHWWSLIGEFGRRYPSWFAMKAFAEVARLRTRVDCPSRFGGNWFALAGREGDCGKILVSALLQDGALRLNLKGGMIPVAVRTFDGYSELASADDWQWDNGRLTVPRHHSSSAFWLVDVKRDDGSLDRLPQTFCTIAEAGRFRHLGVYMPHAIRFLQRADIKTLPNGFHTIFRNFCWAEIYDADAQPSVYPQEEARPYIEIHADLENGDVEVLFPQPDGKTVRPKGFKSKGKRILIKVLFQESKRSAA